MGMDPSGKEEKAEAKKIEEEFEKAKEMLVATGMDLERLRQVHEKETNNLKEENEDLLDRLTNLEGEHEHVKTHRALLLHTLQIEREQRKQKEDLYVSKLTSLTEQFETYKSKILYNVAANIQENMDKQSELLNGIEQRDASMRDMIALLGAKDKMINALEDAAGTADRLITLQDTILKKQDAALHEPNPKRKRSCSLPL